MASRSRKSKKTDLEAIYRLEFYKNKKNWKFRNARREKESQQPSCESQKTESAQDLNKTYVVESIINTEKETSPLNNAFMHDIPTDETPENVPSAPPPTPQPPERTWQQQEAKVGRRVGTWVSRKILTYSETHPEIQNRETLTFCRTDAVQQTLQNFNQDQPDSMKNPCKIESNSPKPNFWITSQTQNLQTQQPWSSQTEINDSSTNSKNIWTGAQSASPELVQQKSSSAQSSASPLSNTEISEKLLKRHTQNVEYQKYSTIPPAVNLQMLLCRQRQSSDVVVQTKTEDKWKNQETAVYPDDQANFINQDAKSELPHRSLKLHEELEFKCPSPRQETYPTAMWRGNQEEPRMRNNPALSPIPEIIRTYSISNEEWQKQEDSHLHQEWSPRFQDVPNCERGEEPEQGDHQYMTVDENTLKAQGSLGNEMLAQEQVRQNTDQWLRILLSFHSPNDNCDIEDAIASDQNQGAHNDSTDFIREAHEVPHSSEKDPNETRECVCRCLPAQPLPSLSSRRLSAALHHSACVLKELLGEQIIRDRLRSSTLLNLIEYPTHDMDLFGSEHVMGGSHVPHSTRDLDPVGGRVIRIDMGRPYRL